MKLDCLRELVVLYGAHNVVSALSAVVTEISVGKNYDGLTDAVIHKVAAALRACVGRIEEK